MLAKDDPLDGLELKQPQELLAGMDYKLVVQFFCVFSRFEHALKMREYLQDWEVAMPNWKRFALDMDGRLSGLSSERLDSAIDYLNATPPEYQMRSLEWSPQKFNVEGVDCRAIIGAKNVRNNLFHGGKYKQPNPERDSALLQSALTVLYGCLLADSELKWAYEFIE